MNNILKLLDQAINKEEESSIFFTGKYDLIEVAKKAKEALIELQKENDELTDKNRELRREIKEERIRAKEWLNNYVLYVQRETELKGLQIPYLVPLIEKYELHDFPEYQKVIITPDFSPYMDSPVETEVEYKTVNIRSKDLIATFKNMLKQAQNVEKTIKVKNTKKRLKRFLIRSKIF